MSGPTMCGKNIIKNIDETPMKPIFSFIGNDVIIGPNSTIGSRGFEFIRNEGQIIAVEHAGGVKVEDRVEIQANCAIDCSVFGEFTEIGEESKLDNLVHIAHNVIIGKRCLLAACAMVAGSTSIGDDVWIGPGTSISSEINIGDGIIKFDFILIKKE